MEDIITRRRVPEFEETCNEEAHQDQTQQGTQQVLGGSAPPSLPLPPHPYRNHFRREELLRQHRQHYHHHRQPNRCCFRRYKLLCQHRHLHHRAPNIFCSNKRLHPTTTAARNSDTATSTATATTNVS
jgi:hypothetical protein